MKIKTIYFFGFTLFKLILKRIFVRKNQEQLLRSEFLKDCIFSIGEIERKIYGEFSRCINCGFCAIDIPPESSYFQHPEFIFNSLTTNLTDITYGDHGVKEIRNFRCPAGAPYKELIYFIVSTGKKGK